MDRITMSLKIGIVGLPNVGKSTLFNALTKKASAQTSNFPFTTIDPNVGIVDVPDDRLQALADIIHPAKIVPATVTFVDIAGLIAGAHKGEGLGNKFLSQIREVDAIAMVIRGFTDPNVTHVSGVVNPIADIDIIQTELALADLETVEKRQAKLEREIKAGDKTALALQPLLARIKQELEQGRGVRTLALSPAEIELLRELQFLTAKPLMFVVNINESELQGAGEGIRALVAIDPSTFTHSPAMPVSAKIEAELAELEPIDQQELLGEYGLTEPGLNRVIREAYTLLGLQTYFTAGPKEVRAWTIQRGDTAPEAAGVIHTDFQHGFIKAKVIAYEDFITNDGERGAQTAGKLRQEGKEYVVQDGDVIEFAFNV